MCWKSTYLMVNQKCEGIPVFHDMMSLQSKLTTWDLGIMMKHENFGLKVTYIKGDDLFNDIMTTSFVRNEYWQEYGH